MKFQKTTSLILSIILILTSKNVFSQQKLNVPSPDPDPVQKNAQISPMSKGRVAPFTGVLFSTKATAVVISEIESVNDKIKIEIDKAVSDLTAKNQFQVSELENRCATEKSISQAEINSKIARINQLTDELKTARKEAADSPSRLLWAGIGVAAGAATAILITFAVNQASK